MKPIIMALMVVMAVSGCELRPCLAYDIPDNMWQGIMAEAANQGYAGMYAVACVYRNRLDKGMPLGCCGLKRKNLDAWRKKQGQELCQTAYSITLKVFELNGEDTTCGATHYENIEAFCMPKWAKNMIITCKIGNHTFFKEKLTH